MIRWDIKKIIEDLGGLREVQKELLEEGLTPLTDKTYYASVGRGSVSSPILANLTLIAKKKGVTLIMNDLVSYWHQEGIKENADQ